MADIGIDVELKPVINEAEFRAKLEAFKNLKLPVTVNMTALKKSINAAVSSAKTNKLKIDVNQPYLASQIKKAINAAGVGKVDNSSSKSSSGSSKSKAASSGTTKAKTSSTKNSTATQLTEEQKLLKQAERKVNGMTQAMKVLRKMSPVDSKSISAADEAMAKLSQAVKGTTEYYIALEKAQQAVKIAYSRNSVRAKEKSIASKSNVAQIRKQLGELKEGNIFGSENIASLEKMIGGYFGTTDYTPDKQKLEKQINKAWAQVSKANSSAARDAANAQGNDLINKIETIRQRGVLKDWDWSGFDEAKTAFYNAAAGTDELERALTRLGTVYDETNAKAQLFNAENTRRVRTQREQEHYSNLYTQASDMIRNNPRISGSYLQGELSRIMNEAKNPGDQTTVEGLQRDLAAARASMEELGYTSETVGHKLTRLFKDHFNTAVAMAGLHLLQNSLQQVLQNVIDVDTAMTDLKKVSNGTDADYAKYLDSASGRAKDLGASITDVIGATSEFSRLGYDLNDASNLGDWATKYMNVSEYTNIEDAAQSLVSTLQGFHLDPDEVGNVVDKFNEIKCLSLCA